MYYAEVFLFLHVENITALLMRKTIFIILMFMCAVSSASSQTSKTVRKHQKTASTEQNAASVIKPLKDSKWQGKKVGFLGNSITEMGYYVRAYAKLTGCKAINFGKSATHMAKIDVNDSLSFDSRFVKLPNDLDMVIVFGGTNDFGHVRTAPFGKFTDGPAANEITFYAGLHRLFKGLSLKYRDKPVVIMTPIHHGSEVDTPEYTIGSSDCIDEAKNPTTGKTFKDYVNAIKEVAAFYSLPVIDAYSSSGLTPFTEIGKTNRYYFLDGLHPNELGGMKLARWMYPQLEMVYDMFY